MNNSLFTMARPKNERVYLYEKGSKEREELLKELKRQEEQTIEIPLIIGGKEVKTGNIGKVVMPHNHKHVLATYHKAGEKETAMAIEAAMQAKEKWQNTSWVERSAIMLKAAELLSKKYRYVINAATMLGQSKNSMQAEIDAACETIDFLRLNSYYLQQIYSDQPLSLEDQMNRMEYRPLEGFIYAITPFNFTSIAANLNLSPALLGNTTVWKPGTTAILSNYYLMKIFKEAGLPDGVVNFLPGSGATISSVVLSHKDLAGIHFTGSNRTFNSLWKQVGENLENYKSYPKIVGETGGKDFIFAHKSAVPSEVATAIVRGAFEFQGQKCSAASRTYISKSIWAEVKNLIIKMLSEIKMGEVKNFENFVNAVIDETSFDNIMSYIEHAKSSNDCEIIAGGNGDKSVGYFVEPTVIVTTNPKAKSIQEEIFGPVMTIFVYEDDKYEETLKLCDETSPYGLTGAVFSRDRYALIQAMEVLKYAAGNFYINDKPTGAMVGLQPFGGARASGTNDKAGGYLNLIRWASPRAIKETYVPATSYEYPFLDK